MPTLPCYQARELERAMAGHRVIGPGGYEGWRFHAGQFDGQGVGVIGEMWLGWPGSGEYARRWWRYRNLPTLFRPPTASEYPAIVLTIIEDSRVLGLRERQFMPNALHADDENLGLRVGGRSVHRDGRSIHVCIGGGASSPSPRTRGEGRGEGSDNQAGRAKSAMDQPSPYSSPWVHGEGTKTGDDVTATFTFAYDDASDIVATEIPLSRRGGQLHQWVVGRSCSKVDGEVRVHGRELKLTGGGWHEHVYGTGPRRECAAWCMRGRQVGPGAGWAFDLMADRRGYGGAAAVCTGAIVRMDEKPSIGVAVARIAIRSAGRVAGVRYPKQLRIDSESGPLELSAGRVIGRRQWGLDVMYQSTWEDRPGIVLAQVDRWSRSGWPWMF